MIALITASPAMTVAWTSILRKRSSRPSPRRPRIRLAAAAEKYEQTEPGDDRERDQPASRVYADPLG
jgi:hypothetical protein